MITSGLTMVVAGLIALLTWAVSRNVLKDNPVLSNPIIPICVAGISYIGLTTMGGGWAQGIVLLYAAMAIAILLVLLFGWATGRRFAGPSREPKEPRKSSRAFEACEPTPKHFRKDIENERTEGDDNGYDE